MNRPYSLLSILLHYAPDNQAQQHVSTIYNKMWEDNLSATEIENQLITALHDGIAYGNWPWVIQDLTTNSIKS